MIQIPNYTVLEAIYQTTDIVVYRGIRESDGTRVAIKACASKFPSASELARIHHEHALLRELDIPGVIKTLGLEPCEAGVALILEDVAGQSLAKHLEAKRLDLKSTLLIASTVAASLEALHQRSILHKDVTPNNILITPGGAAILIDVGLASRLSREPQRALRPAKLEGTLAYMSPEQTGRMNRSVDQRSDLYSLGATLYEVIAGEPPFLTDDPTDLLHSHIARAPVALSERVPGLPTVVSDIVAKLLAKPAEDRYQSARCLKADLDECLSQLSATGDIAPFPLGRHDVSTRFTLSQKLYGRDDELAQLFEAFDRVQGGAAELLLVSGSAGVGKSALIHEVHKPIARRGGYFVAGKYDQFLRNVPCAPIARALRDLVQQILTEPTDVLERWKTDLLRALGSNGQLVTDLIPELALIIGHQPPVQEVGSSESQNRFALIFQSFLQVFCAVEHPLVLFLDDLQWADLASLKLIELLLTTPGAGHLLVIGAYRDNEVNAAHPLSKTVAHLLKAGDKVSDIQLDPLDVGDVTDLLVDTLSQRTAQVEVLAQVVWDKTHGNPFFVNQLLQQLHRDAILTFHLESEAWRWDVERVADVAAAGNVVQFMAAKIERLAPATQRTLQLAACIGHRFDLRALSIICETPWYETAQGLWEALQEGLVLPLSAEYRFVHHSAAQYNASTPQLPSPEFPVLYRFLHDRVQQAAYSMIGEAQRQQVHLSVGRLMLAQSGGEAREEQVFDITGHMNRGASLLTDPEEKLRLARLNLSAGRKAKVAAAYETAADYFTAGISLLSSSSWQDEHELTVALHLEQAQAEQMSGRLDRAEALLDELLPKARSRLHRTKVQGLRVVLFASQVRWADAVEAARSALTLFDIDLPSSPEESQRALQTQLAAIETNLAGRRPEDLIDAPVMTDPDQREILRLLARVAPSALVLDPTLMVLVVALQVNISLVQGNSDWSCYGYAGHAIIVGNVFNQYEASYAWGQLALSLDEKFKNVDLTGPVYQMIAGHVFFFKSPLRDSLPLLEYGYQAALVAGDLTYLSYVTFCMGFNKFGVGMALEALEEDINRYLVLMERTKDGVTTSLHRVTRQMIRNLTGRTRSRTVFGDDGFDEGEFVEAFKRDKVLPAGGWYYLAKSLIAFLNEDYAEAVAMATEGEPCIAGATGMYFGFDLRFYSCLAMLALSATLPAAAREPYRERIQAHRDLLEAWSASCPQNFRHKLLLVDAELARLAGSNEAVRLYNKAIGAARADGFPHQEAIANERCASFYLSLDNPFVASIYMTAAHAGYARWGATTKVQQIEERYPRLLIGAMRQAPLSARGQSSSNVALDYLDYTTALRAAQAIAGEILMSRVVDRLMRIVLADAGAQVGALVLHRGDQLFLNATLAVDPEVIEVGLSVPVDERQDIPRGLLNYVARTRKSIIVDDAASDSRFGSDPAIAARQLKSVLCTPLIHQGQLIGLLVLGSTISHVFTPARVELLELLSTQTAISIENATLYEELDERVQERTRDLEEAQRKLLDTAHRAGMAEIATRVLHNVGNVLTSVTVSSGLLSEQLKNSQGPVLGRVAKLMREQRENLGEFMSKDPRGKQIPEFVETLAIEIEKERQTGLKELEWLQRHIGHIRDIIALQQSFAGVGALIQPVMMTELIEDALRISGALPERDEMQIVREYADISGPCQIEKHAVLQILVNLLTNAIQALSDTLDPEVLDPELPRPEPPIRAPRRLTLRLKEEDAERVRIEVSDNGKGISLENLPLIFTFGFTTRPGGHGFGLHSCAVNAKSMGAEITVETGGLGKGATFTLLLPRNAAARGGEARA